MCTFACALFADEQVPAEQSEADELVSMWVVHYPEADALLEQVLSTLPRLPIRLEGELRTKPAGDTYQSVARVTMQLNAEGQQGSAVYDVTDMFGSQPQRLIVQRSHAGQRLAYKEGEPPVAAPFPGLSHTIRNSDLTWGDLTLSFLWWEGGKTVGREKVRGRSCYVVELPAPADLAGSVRSMKVWIDPKIGMLLRADSLDADGQRIRSFSVKKFRKIDDVWMVSDIHARSFLHAGASSLLIHAVSVDPGGDTGTLPATTTPN